MTKGFDPTLRYLARSWDQAVDAKALEVRSIEVAGLVLRFEAAGTVLIDRLWPALAHHPAAVSGPGQDQVPSATVRLWDLATTGAPRPPLPDALFAAERTLIRGFATDGDRRIGFSPDSGMLTLWDEGTKVLWCCTEDPTAIPWWEQAAPLRTPLSWWLETNDRFMVHGAVVGDEDGAVVLAGRGGSGKSTTALACHLAGLGYLGDDYCAVSMSDGPTAHSLYGSAKLVVEDQHRHGALASVILNPEAGADEKVVALVSRAPGARMVPSAPIAAVMAVRVGTDSRTRVSPASQAEALKALAPSSILQLRGIGATTMTALADLVRSVPVGILELGRDRDEIVETVAALAQGKLSW